MKPGRRLCTNVFFIALGACAVGGGASTSTPATQRAGGALACAVDPMALAQTVDGLVLAAWQVQQQPSTAAQQAWKDALQQAQAHAAGLPAGCVPNLARFVTVQQQRFLPGHGMGMAVTDDAYFEQTGHLTAVPDALLDQDFLAQVSEVTMLAQAKAYLHGLNATRQPQQQLVFYSFVSQHLGTPDHSGALGRLLVVVPGPVERFVQFGWSQDGQRVRNVSVVAVDRPEDGPPNVYFQDHYRTWEPDGHISVQGRHLLGQGSFPCIQCHRSGVLPVYPAPQSVAEDEVAALHAINARALAAMPASYGGFWDAQAFGPGLGAGNTTRTNAWMQRCMPEGLSEATGRVADAARCGACHNAQGLGALSFPFNATLIRSYVLSGRMPPDNSLQNTNEREALYGCLVADFFDVSLERPGVLKSWLLGETTQQVNPQ